MCFGDTKTQEKTTQQAGTSSQNVALPDWLNAAAQGNYNFAQGISSKPYTPYSGDRVADLTGDQNSAFDMIRQAAGSTNPYAGTSANFFENYGSAPASSVSAPSVLGSGTDAKTAQLSDYVTPYIQQTLDPQLAEIQRQTQIQKDGAGGSGSAATASGAFGDARDGIERGQIDEAGLRAASSATGAAYDKAFQQAAQLRGLDISNLIGTQTTNANLNEQALSRQLGAGGALTGLDQATINRVLQLSGALGGAGATQQAQQQQELNVPYSDYLAGSDDPYKKLQALIASLNGASGNVNKNVSGTTSMNGTETTKAPDNSGWGILGAALPLLL